MNETEILYEGVRQVLSPSVCYDLPKNELTDKLLKNIFTVEEAVIVANGIKKAFRPVTVRKIRKRTKMPKDQLKEKLEDMKYKGKLIKKGPFCIVLGYLPGFFEFYFTIGRDNPERIKKAGEAHYELLKAGFYAGADHRDYPIFRVLPTIEPTNSTIEINKELDVDYRVMPYEVLEKYLSKLKTFAIQPCSCRTAAKLAGNPCKRTDENFCISGGFLAKEVINNGSGKQVSLEELMEIMKRAEKEGLIHQTINMKKTSVFICNCCPCCCGAFKQVKELGKRQLISESNFQPEINLELCEECLKCVNICPMEAISQNGEICIDLNKCIGCGLCASNCPNHAIELKKIRNIKLPKGLFGVLRKMIKDGKYKKK